MAIANVLIVARTETVEVKVVMILMVVVVKEIAVVMVVAVVVGSCCPF